MDGFQPGEECIICQGKCCREHGCVLAPCDLFRALRGAGIPCRMGDEEGQITRETLLAFLQREENLFAIDRMHGGLYFLRMRHKCYNFIGVDAMGECVALTEKGCSLAYEERPKGGRYLKSSPDFHCAQQYTAEMMAEDWAPFQELLQSIWEEYEPKFEADGTFDRCDEEYFRWMRSKTDT